MIDFPYGIADFRRIRQQGMVYVDRTDYLRQIERLGSILTFLRPRRFGKSLWLQTLASYYDLRRKDEYESLFSGLAIDDTPGPTAHAHRYFVLEWNFSVVDPAGGAERIADHLREHVRARAETFVTRYRETLPAPIEIAGSPAAVLESLLRAIEQTPYRLYLLVDEYDNFINEVMASDLDTYRALVHTEGPFKQLFKAVKNATEGRGLERVFITGGSPLALNDLTSGFNIAKDVSLEPGLAGLCGFQEGEVRSLLERVGDEQGLTAGEVEGAAATLRTWYNGYHFAETAAEPIYNPTNVFYFLDHLQRHRKPPAQLYDQNLRTDRGKLVFIAQTAAGAGIVEELTRSGEITLPRLETSFSLDQLTANFGEDRGVVGSFLYYLGMLTLTDVPGRLQVPNLVVRKLLLDRLLDLYLPEQADGYAAREMALRFYQEGELSPLLAFFEKKILGVLSNRDRGGLTEMVIKALFLSILFDDTRYVIYSEPELSRSYADLCLLVREGRRRFGLLDLLFEIKLVRRKELGRSGQELASLDDEELRRLPAVARALAEASEQLTRYRTALLARYGENLKLRSYAVVAVDLDRLIGEEVGDGAEAPSLPMKGSPP